MQSLIARNQKRTLSAQSFVDRPEIYERVLHITLRALMAYVIEAKALSDVKAHERVFEV